MTEEKKYTMFDAATDLETVFIWMEQLLDLVTVYQEHRENELTGIDPKKPCTIVPLLRRQGLGYALMDAIKGKAGSIMEFAQDAQAKAYAAK